MSHLLNRMTYVSPQRGMPVDNKGASSVVSDITGETVQLYYFNSGTYTADAGEAAGTLVVGRIDYNNVLNSIGSAEATVADTSMSFTSTAFTTEVGMNITALEDGDGKSLEDKLTLIANNLANGEFCWDYSNGIVYGKKATTASTLTSTSYKVFAGSTSGSTSITSLIPGTGATNLGKAEDAAHTSGDVGVMSLVVRNDTLAALAGTDGDYAPLQVNASGALYGQETLAPVAEDNTNGVIATAFKPTTDTDYAPSNTNTSAYAASLIIKASAGTCYEIRGYNSGAGQFIQVHDSATLPADTAVPEDIVFVPSASSFSVTYPVGKAFAAGIVVCNSSTGATKTIGSADCWYSAEFI